MDSTEKRWRLMLGLVEESVQENFSESEIKMTEMLDFLYQGEDSKDRKGGLGKSSPKINRWLGDIRQYFPRDVVRVLQKDALDRLGLKQMLLEPETLEMIEPDAKLVATLISLSKIMPARTKETARLVVEKVVASIRQKIQMKMERAVRGALSRSSRQRNPKLAEINWLRTIEKNLKNYRPEINALIPEQMIGIGRRGNSLKDIIICVDQSGSMAGSVIYAGVFAAVMASLPALRTKLIYFDTAVADVSEHLHDPVELLFGVQLGGGTDIAKALTYARGHITRPQDSLFILISDLFEGGDRRKMIQQAAAIRQSGAKMITLLALDDEGTPAFDHQIAQMLFELDIPVFACTPDKFPDLLAAAIQNLDLKPFQ